MTTRSRSLFCRAPHVVLFVAILIPLLIFAQVPTREAPPTDLANMNIEDLMKVEVTSVSKTRQTLSQTAAAVFVITQDDIQRSGATNIPDLLRMVPGMDVAQINSHAWGIATRGFNERFANELLVLVDGRPVYLPTFGGVFWDTLDIPLEDIERIEVIRGPGGSVWGANAVNGIINIITKRASDTQGVMVVAGAGDVHSSFGTLQYGGKFRKSLDYRAFMKYFNENALDGPSGTYIGDGWHSLRGGFRADAALTPRDNLTVQGDLYTNREGSLTFYLPSITSPAVADTYQLSDQSGGFLQTIWNHSLSDRSHTQLMISYDHYANRDMLGESRGTLDVDFQHNFNLDRHKLIWGFDYRYSSMDTRGSLAVSLVPASRENNLYSGFVQDEIAVRPDRLYLTIGTKLEGHYYSGFFAMPSVRLAWTPNSRNTLWAAFSRAERTPSDLDHSLRVNLGALPGSTQPPTVIASFGNPSLKNEGLLAYEAGYRASLTKRLSLDLAAYYNAYDHQQTLEPSTPFFEESPAPPHIVFPLVYQNLMHGETHGLEVFADWRLTSRWILSPGYAFERIHMHVEPSSQDTGAVGTAEGSSPVHSAQLRSHYQFPHGLSWDVSAFFNDRLADLAVPSYTRLDTQMTWQWKERLTLSAVGQNLAQDKHLEFVDVTAVERSSLAQRSGYAKLTWYF